MINIELITQIIQTYFPDLANTYFSINNNTTPTFTERYLLPYMIYNNSVNPQNRVIGLYLPEDYNIVNLIPFYIIMGKYRKALNNTQHGFTNQYYTLGQKQVVYKGNICSITSVEFINRQITITSGIGHIIKMTFTNLYQLQWEYRSAHDVRDLICSFKKIDKAVEGNIFNFPIPPTYDEYEGAIIFTNTSKFESLLQNVKVSDSDLRKHLNIQKVVFSPDEIKFQLLSNTRKTGNKPVSILIARHDAFRAYEAIIEAGNGDLDHIKTIIIDGFDELSDRWNKSDRLNEEYRWLNDNYFERVYNHHLNNIYLITKNNNLYIHDRLINLQINYTPWLLNPVEEQILNNGANANLEANIVVTNIGCIRYEDLNRRITNLLYRWRILAQESFCNGEVLKPISCLNELSTKLNSFYDPDSFTVFRDSFLSTLDQIQIRWFANGQDYNIIIETQSLINDIFNIPEYFVNYKLQCISDLVANMNINGSICIVSDNTNMDDKRWIEGRLNAICPNISATCYHKSKLHNINSNNDIVPTAIFYLTSNRKLVGTVSSNILANRQVFVLDSRSYSFTMRTLRRHRHLQVEVGNINTKHELLGVEVPPNMQVDEMNELIPIDYRWHDIDNANDGNNNPNDIDGPDDDYEDPVDDLDISPIIPITPRGPVSMCIMLFDDNTSITVPLNRNFFIYEDSDFKDVDKLMKPTIQLKEGDQIITTKSGVHAKELMEQSLKKNPNFRQIIKLDERWRLQIKNYLGNSMDVEYFCKKLKEHGFIIGPAAVVNWIDNETRRPDNFKKLLLTLNIVGIIDINDINSLDKANSELKSIQIKFIRTAMQKLIAQLNGIHLEEDEVFTNTLLDEFINHIEIKKIYKIYHI
ncbi:hypothetical protein [Telluribacter sp.]|jgi:hypothetical protein|uniref:hypothetical protein n=1 Tax=Telluribacter sp. TaxID=1978767 RepID=UPI002E0E55B5|nr:hypothetical protein [Telluribacter sp.]